MTTNWNCNRFDIEKIKKHLPRESVQNHPLQLVVVKNINVKTSYKQSSETSSDPLTVSLEGLDPLSAFANEFSSTTYYEPSKDKKSKGNEWCEVWNSRRAGILIHYTTAEKLSIISSFLPGGEKMIMKTQTRVVDQVKNRLEQLDDFEEGSVRQMLDLSQQEYVSRIDMLNRELVQAWNTKQRVKSLKIAIQCSKLLTDTSVMPFYPSKFVLITDILDIFGKLVIERIKEKSKQIDPITKKETSLPDNFTPDMVPEVAKEICQNWLHKMASIRELVPRLYIEMSLLKCYKFLSQEDYSGILNRLTLMIRGIGHPLVAAYARLYLCRIGLNMQVSNTEYFLNNVNDSLLTINQVFSNRVTKEYQSQHIYFDTYANLYKPVFDWLFYGLVHWCQVNHSTLDKLVEKCKEIKHCGILFRSILTSFKTDYITSRALQFYDLIENMEAEEYVISDMLTILGNKLCSGGGSENDKLLIKSAWKCMQNFHKTNNYLQCVEPWMQFTAMRFSAENVDWLLKDFLESLETTSEPIEKHCNQLQNIIKKIIINLTDVEGLFMMDYLIPAIEKLNDGPVQVDICRLLLNTYQAEQNWFISDPKVIKKMKHVCLILHNSVSALTVEDETRNIGIMISKFIKFISYGKELDKQLMFYVECRGAFYKIESIHVTLVQYVNFLAAKIRKITYGKHTKQTGWFAHACIAYNFVTIPALSCPFTKLQLYLITGQVALMNHCLAQAVDCFKEAMTLIVDVPPKRMIDGQQRSTDAFLVSYLSSFLSTLLVVPDKVGSNKLYMVKGFLKSINRLPWEATNPSRYTLLLKSLDLLGNMAQADYLYHIKQVDSNDTLYGSDEEFLSEINKVCGLILDEMLSILKELGENNEHHKQSTLALELFIRVFIRGDLKVKEMESLAVNLWNLAHRHKDCVDIKLSNKILYAVQCSAERFIEKSESLNKIKGL